VLPLLPFLLTRISFCSKSGVHTAHSKSDNTLSLTRDHIPPTHTEFRSSGTRTPPRSLRPPQSQHWPPISELPCPPCPFPTSLLCEFSVPFLPVLLSSTVGLSSIPCVCSALQVPLTLFYVLFSRHAPATLRPLASCGIFCNLVHCSDTRANLCTFHCTPVPNLFRGRPGIPPSSERPTYSPSPATVSPEKNYMRGRSGQIQAQTPAVCGYFCMLLYGIRLDEIL
jgi:hypothetical protein